MPWTPNPPECGVAIPLAGGFQVVARFSAPALPDEPDSVLPLRQNGPWLPGRLPGKAAKHRTRTPEPRTVLFSRAAPKRDSHGGCRGRRSCARLAPTRPRHALGMPCAHQPLGTGCPRAEARSTIHPAPAPSIAHGRLCHISHGGRRLEVGDGKLEAGVLVAVVSNQMHVLFCIDCISCISCTARQNVIS